MNFRTFRLMKRHFLVVLAALVLAACQDAIKPELTTPEVSRANMGAPVATFTVTNTNDAGAGSLRQAILDANAIDGFDAIEFSIPAATDDGCNAATGVCTIRPVGGLPFITDPVVIDGYTQPGAFPNTNPVGLGLNTVLKIEIDGSFLAGPGGSGALVITADNTIVRGLVINRVSNAPCCGLGIDMRGHGPAFFNTIIEGNFIGTDVTGTLALGNIIGVGIGTGDNHRIGGTTPAARNLISGNTSHGMVISGSATDGNVIQGNLIGTDVTGTVALGNIEHAVFFSGTGTNNLVGGTAPGARNVISGNGRLGVGLSVANDTRVEGNFIGTDVTGTLPLGNGAGISIHGENNTIGGTAPGARNVISGNGGGITIFLGTGNRVEGNFIGTDETGSLDLGNVSVGVTIFASPNNTIGGIAPGAGNIIAYNGEAGVWVREGTSTGNAILSNSIFANVPLFGDPHGLGIDLGPINSLDGVTPNDPGDVDTGVNNLQNFPVVTSSFTAGGIVAVEGTLNSTSSATFRLEFFANAAADPTGHGEGETFIGATDVTTDASGDASFAVSFVAAVPAGQFISATATDPAGSTSEFSGLQEAKPGLMPQQQLEAKIAELQEIVDNNLGTPLADKLEDAIASLTTASEELDKTPPDDQAAVGNIEGAVGDVEAALNDGLYSAEVLNQCMDRLAGIARQLAVSAVDEAIVRGGDPGSIADAQESLADGDAHRASGEFKDAIGKYKDALAKAESA